MTAVEALASDAIGASTEAAADRLRRSVLLVRGRAGTGSATVWRADGLLATNHHVVADEHAKVETWDGSAH